MRVAVLLPKHCRCSRPYVASLARALPVLRVLPSFHSFVPPRVVLRDLEPLAREENRQNSLFPVCASVFSGVCTVREQSEQSTISCVINESYYIAGVSPDCMLSTRTMIARRIPPINQSESPQVTGASQRTPQQTYITPSRKLIRRHYSCQNTPVKYFFSFKSVHAGLKLHSKINSASISIVYSVCCTRN